MAGSAGAELQLPALQVRPAPPGGALPLPGWALPHPRLCLAVLLLAGILAAALGLGITWLTCTLVLAACALTSGTRTLLSALPAALVCLICGLGSVLLCAAALGFPLLHAPGVLRLVLAAGALTAGLLALSRLPDRLVLLARVEVVPALPALLLALLGLSMALRGPGAEVSWLLLGGDASYHVLFAAGIDHLGVLSYSTSGYPRMLHGAVAVLAAAGDPDTPQATLGALLPTFARVQWLAWSLTVLATSLLGARLAAPAGVRLAPLAGLLAGLVLCSGQFLGFVLAYGFFTTALLALVLVVLVYELTEREASSPGLVVLAGTCFTLVAHTWQLGLVPLGIIWAAALWCWYRERSQVVWVCAATTVLAALCLPPLQAVVFHVGVGQAVAEGEVGGLPRTFLLAGLLATALGLWSHRALLRRRGALPLSAGLATPLLLALTAVGLAVLTGVSVELYYPRKLLWNAAALGLAPLAALLVLLLAALLPRVPSPLPPLGRVLLAGLGGGGGLVALVIVAITPFEAVTGRWFPGERVLEALTTPGTDGATVPWLVSPERSQLYADQITHALLGIHLVEGDVIDPSRRGNSPTERLCAYLAPRPGAELLSALPPERFAAESGCPETLPTPRRWIQVRPQ